MCNRKEPNRTTCWICFFYFNLCFPLLLFTKRILCIHNGLPRGNRAPLPEVNPKCLCSGKHPDPVHLWMAVGKKKLTHPLPEAGHSRGYLQNLWSFYFTSSSPPPLCAIKETGIQTAVRWLVLRLQSSRCLKSSSLPQHLVSDLLASCAASRASLGSVTSAVRRRRKVWIWEVLGMQDSLFWEILPGFPTSSSDSFFSPLIFLKNFIPLQHERQPFVHDW